MRHFGWLLLGALGFGCAPPSRAVPIVGPDGSRMLHVSCASDEARCYQLASEHCPYGYDLSKTASEGNFLLRCRAWQAGPATSFQPTPLVVDPYAAPQLAPSPYGSAAPPPGSPYPPLGGGNAGSANRPGDIGY